VQSIIGDFVSGLIKRQSLEKIGATEGVTSPRKKFSN